MRLKNFLTAALACVTFVAPAFAGTVTGQVLNGTTSKPAAGDEVAILSLMQGMQEIGHTKTDASGNFKIDVPDDGTPHMVRVEHQGVSYFPKGGPLMPGATSATVQVYDVVKKADVGTTVNVMRVQADNNTLQATELYAVQNSTTPPKTVFDDTKTYEFTLPEGAVVDSAAARTQDGQPVNTNPTPLKEKNHFAFSFPLRPGETQFQLSWHMPYKGEISLAPKPVTAMQHFVVMFPKTMKFEAKSASAYAPMNDDTGAGIQVASDVKPGADLSFKMSGTGAIAEAGTGGQGGPAEGGGGQQMPSGQVGRPGGGLGPPIEAPDPLEKYRWVILGVIVVAMLGAALIVSRRNPAQPVRAEEVDEDVTAAPRIPANIPAAPRATASNNGDRSSLLMEAMKEELFQLEIDRQQGKVTEAEYQKAKAALDETIKRALARKSQTSA
ncbi:hypothetical protein Acid345_3204 [Candidatus Koribacter versatilis Ellin345]|uniref:Carboxypeptidase regulatory-like domain-containing protein n=1 Tax=Koribacter versatilis (strain Ellin345) TaxID=204669 RepID=Q1ILP5_KORVE|nr:hypothetical protein [Candidatus Koribacter versatilis]ABF42205.1 hypothetical protein Acid345_3204 [Candidatus Koribacter versatilis Ellin345]